MIVAACRGSQLNNTACIVNIDTNELETNRHLTSPRELA